MLKKDLELRVKELVIEVEELESEVEGLNDYIYSLELDLANRPEKTSDFNYIADLKDFIWELKLRGLYTPELGEFIEDYAKYCD